MTVQDYINSKKEMYENLLSFINNSSDQNNFTQLMEIINMQKILDDKNEFTLFLYLINTIAQNHQRNDEFFGRIEQILNQIKESIKQTYSNLEIFNIFKENKRILLYLIESAIITFDKSISDQILQLTVPVNKIDLKNVNLLITNQSYLYYFYPEIKDYLTKEYQNTVESSLELILGENWDKEFENDRKKGENSTLIGQLIRQDSVEEFISYINRKNISPSSYISPSIFETNSILVNQSPTLIEYALFFGSIQIIRYLLFNNVEINSNLWIYAIHSGNGEVIHLLEENHVEPPAFYTKCLEESIKCHHNEIALYIYDNLMEEATKSMNNNGFDESIISFSYHYYNYHFFPKEIEVEDYHFFYSIKYNYINLVKIFINKGNYWLQNRFIFN